MDERHKKKPSGTPGDDAEAPRPDLCCCYILDERGGFQDPCPDSVDHCGYPVREKREGR